MRTRLSLLLLLLGPAACRVADAPPPEPLAPLEPLAEWPAETGPPAEAACMLVAVDTVSLRARPSAASDAAGALAAGDSARVVGRAPGWLALADTSRSGPFAARWADADGPFALRGACDAVATRPLLPPSACLAAATRPGSLPLYARPDTASSVVATLPQGDAAEVVSRSAAGWLRVRLAGTDAAPGPPGWLAPGTATLDGADCAAR